MSRLMKNGLWLTEHRKGGKMMGKDTIMVSHPSFCSERCSGVCGKCYSKRLSAYRPNLAKWQQKNTDVLSDPGFTSCLLHTIDGTIRWSSMGELSSDMMLKNIYLMARDNKHLTHAIWSKMAGIVKRCAKYREDNIILVWSATKIDYQKPFVPRGYDLGFFVYSDESKIPEGVFHCQKKCSDCGFCYRPGAYGIVGEVIR